MRCGAALLAACAAFAAGAVGCGVGAGGAPSGVELTVTTGFGQRALTRADAPRIDGAETVMRLLQRNAKVKTRYGGGFVQSIDGLAGGRDGGAPVDWFYYVNGIEARKGAAATKVHDGDRVWWDRHDWGDAGASRRSSARSPSRSSTGRAASACPCASTARDPSASACKAVQGRLTRARPRRRHRDGERLARRSETLAGRRRPLGAGRRGRRGRPARARPGGERRLRAVRPGRPRARSCSTPDGRVRADAGAGTGLVAAARVEDEQPDLGASPAPTRAGVAAAAAAFDEGTLEDQFAVAVEDGAAVALPVQPAVAPGP